MLLRRLLPLPLSLSLPLLLLLLLPHERPSHPLTNDIRDVVIYTLFSCHTSSFSSEDVGDCIQVVPPKTFLDLLESDEHSDRTLKRGRLSREEEEEDEEGEDWKLFGTKKER